MTSVIPEPRKELSPYAPKIKTMQIDPEKIKDVIGKGGETITKIILESSNVATVSDKDAVKIDIDDNGFVIAYHTDYAIIDRALAMIEEITREVEIGKVYTGKVVKVQDFGCFVQLWPGCEGLCHVSQLDHKRVEHPKDIVKEGDEIIVKAIGYDKRGKLDLSRKAALPEPEKKETPKEEVKPVEQTTEVTE